MRANPLFGGNSNEPKTKKGDAAYHSFDAEIALQVSSVHAAIVYSNIVFWVRHSETNGKKFHEGRYWTYNSLKAFGKQFPYLTVKQIRTALEKLLEAGLIVKGNFAEDRFKRDIWYSLGDQICPEGQTDQPETANDTFATEGNTSAREGKCIKNKYKPDSKPYPLCPGGAEADGSDFDAVWEVYPSDRRRDRTKCERLFAEALKQVSLNELVVATQAYAAESSVFERSKVSFMDNWLRDEKWRRHIGDLRQKGLDAEACAVKQAERIASWIRDHHPMCQHITKSQVSDAIKRGLISKAEASAAGVLR